MLKNSIGEPTESKESNAKTVSEPNSHDSRQNRYKPQHDIWNSTPIFPQLMFKSIKMLITQIGLRPVLRT